MTQSNRSTTKKQHIPNSTKDVSTKDVIYLLLVDLVVSLFLLLFFSFVGSLTLVRYQPMNSGQFLSFVFACRRRRRYCSRSFAFFYLSPSYLRFIRFILHYSIEINKLTQESLYDYFRALKLLQEIAHLRHQYHYPANFILLLKSNVRYLSIYQLIDHLWLLL